MRFVFFDLDDTLVDSRTALRAWAADFAADFVADGWGDGTDTSADTAADVFKLVDAAVNWPEFVTGARERYGITAPDERLMAHVVDRYPGKFVLEQRVRSGLAELRAAGWLLGIVTNGSTRVQQAKVDSVGLRPYVDAVVDSEGAGARKPERRIFEVAADRLGVELGPEGWMVGDRLDKDVAGGQAAGLRTIWVGTGAQPGEGTPQPTRAVATVDEAFEVIRESGTMRQR